MTEPDAQGEQTHVEESASTGTPVVEATPTEETRPVYWNELNSLPEDVRPLVEPIFKEWDTNVAKRLQGVHSEYEPYKPLFDEWEPEALSSALGLAQALEENPQEVIAQLAEAYGIDLGQGAASPQQSEPQAVEEDTSTEPDDPRFQLLEALARTVIEEREQRSMAEAQAELDTVLEGLRQQYGDYDENYVLSLIANEVEPEQAVAMFQQSVQQYAAKLNAPQANAPTVLGQGGGYPSQQVDPATLSNKDTEALVAQMLRAANQQG